MKWHRYMENGTGVKQRTKITIQIYPTIFLFLSIVLIYFYIRRTRKVKEEPVAGKKLYIYPGRLILIAVFISASILTLSGVLDIPRLIVNWLTFQGI